MTPKTILIISQVFVPDPASVGQHIADVAYELARRNHRVLVNPSRRGFENPGVIYPARETINNVEIRRLPFASFGKQNILPRILGTATFMTQAFFRALSRPATHKPPPPASSTTFRTNLSSCTAATTAPPTRSRLSSTLP